MDARDKDRISGVSVSEDHTGGEYSDGSRRDGHTTAATTRDRRCLGTMATVMDAGIAMGWSGDDKVATDSQGAIERILEWKFKIVD